MPLTKEQRDALPADQFAVPGKRKLPIHDAEHVRLAWSMVDRTQGLTPGERSEARAHILRRGKELGVDTASWEKTLKHAALTLSIEAMAIVMPDVADHPNRMPFTGVLTFVDTPSDLPVGGAGGKRVILPRTVAQEILPSLLGMAIDFTPNLDGHDVTRKIGLITSADVVGDEIQIGGFFYAADFPQVCARIKAEKEALGFSYEIKAQTQEIGDLLQIVSGVFTGAAVLRKDKAAYQSTSLAANAAGDIDMTPEELKKMLEDAVKPLASQLNALTTDLTALKASTAPLQANAEMRARIAPHATTLRNCAAAMEAAGIGLDSRHGHVAHLHRMAGAMEAEAAQGKLPHIYRDHDWIMGNADRGDNRSAAPSVDTKVITDAIEAAVKPLKDGLEAQGTKITDLSAKAFSNAEAPQRRTLSGEGAALLAKAGLKLEGENGKVSVHALDQAIEKAGLGRQDGIALKLSLQSAGRLEAA
jgi:hypothetical protein